MEIKHYPFITNTQPVSREQEKELLNGIHKKDNASRDKLILCNLRFVLKVALHYRGYPIKLDDLVSEGILGLIEAVDKFENGRDIRFISYAVWHIRARITKAISFQCGIIRLPENKRRLIRGHLKKIAGTETMTVPDEIQQLININGRGRYSLHCPHTADVIKEELIDSNDDPEERMGELERRTIIKKILKMLPERELDFIVRHFGIDKEKETYEQIAYKCDISKERVRQIVNSGIRRLRRHCLISPENPVSLVNVLQ